MSGTTVVQTVSREVAATLNAGEKAALAAVLDSVLGRVRGIEL